MQKALKRSLLARNQAIRAQRTRGKEQLKRSRLTNENTAYQKERVINDEVKNERLARRVDWELGPLAPKRDVGDNRNTFGTRPMTAKTPTPLTKLKRKRFINFAVDDRVCVIRGNEKGKIGKVLEIDKSSHTMRVAGINRVDVALHKFQIEERQGMTPFVPEELPISLDDVRLVVPLKDPATEEVKEVIIKDMYGGGPRIQQVPHSQLPTHTRYVKGLDMPVPWPLETTYQQPEYKSDTTRYHVEHETFLPSIISTPLPAGAINELRNAYGKARSDYEEDYVMEKLMEDLRKNHQDRQRLVSPSSELWHHRQMEKVKQRSLTISEETSKLIEQTQRLTLKRSPEVSVS